MGKQRILHILLTLLLSLLLCGSLVTVSVFYIATLRKSLRNEAYDSVREAVRLGSDVLSRTIHKDMQIVNSLSGLLSRFSGNEQIDEILNFVSKYAGDNGFSEAVIADANGEAISKDGVRFSVKGQESFEHCMGGRNGISDPFTSKLNGKTIVAFYAPLYWNGEIVGTVDMSKPTDELQQAFSISFYQGAGYSYIIDRQGERILTYDHPEADRMNTNLLTLLHEDNAGEEMRRVEKEWDEGISGTACLRYGSQKKYIAYKPIEGTEDWLLVCVVPESALMSRFQTVLYGALLLCTILLVLFLIIMILYRRGYKAKMKMAYTDPVTGASNWGGFQQAILRQFNGSPESRFTFVLLDLHRFREVNETIGYSEANRLLRYIADEIDRATGRNELFSRIAGDKFAIMMESREEGDIECRLTLLTQKITEFDITASLHRKMKIYYGLVRLDTIQTLEQDWLREATKCAYAALRYAKQQDDWERNRARAEKKLLYAVYDDTMMQREDLEHRLEREMADALESGQFEVYLQPKVHLHTGQTVGAEALIRWRHPELGLISPGIFIPLFERNHFIIQMDRYVYRMVCRTLRRWIDTGYKPLPISVNVSRLHLYDDGFVDKLIALVEEEHISPEYLELEFTESLFADEMELFNSVLDRLSAHGFLLSMDDFGSGYSNLNLLKDIRVDVLKMDREFLRDIMVNPRGEKVLRGVMDIARRLSLQVVCEGIETQEQADKLKQIGCDIAQGFWFARPMPMNEFEKTAHMLQSDDYNSDVYVQEERVEH